MVKFPSDWPGPGAIDLALQDLPHDSSASEWWYVNSHFKTQDGRELSLFAAFFRVVDERNKETGEPLRWAHSLTWALTDVADKRYYSESRVDERAPAMGLERLDSGRGHADPRLNRAMREILANNQFPAPDREFDGPVEVSRDKLELIYGRSARFGKLGDGSYRLWLRSERQGVECELTFAPKSDVMRHGDDGIVRGHAGEDMFYYSITRCAVSGSVRLERATENPGTHSVSGMGWYDHEFGCYLQRDDEPRAADAKSDSTEEEKDALTPMSAWNWTSMQLEDGTDISAYEIVDRADKANPLPWGQWLVAHLPDGSRRATQNVKFHVGRKWQSTRTFHDYPVEWRMVAPDLDLELHMVAEIDDQEFITLISKPAFWEGRCQIRGRMLGKEVKGLGFIERSGFEYIDNLDEFFTEVGRRVRKSVAEAIPTEPTPEELLPLIASDDAPQYMRGVDPLQMAKTLLEPIREITDRGGKSWRSYAALACCDVVGGDSRDYVQWLAMPELLHVGSLIVDDVQDRSEIRRGGPSCHLMYGDAIAINSGTAAYFLMQKLLVANKLTPEQKLRIYDLYFLGMRAGHAGQAIDLRGVEPLLPAAVESGDSTSLEERILACHRLKTAAPAASLARMGAVAGGGTEEQVDAVGAFFEAVGMAFQMFDDVLNLRGFRGDLKQRGEDISNGTITLPVAKSMSRLPAAERKWVADIVCSKTKDQNLVNQVVEKLEACGAIEACASEARDLVERTWVEIEPKLEPSIYRVMLRAFGWYVIERHY